jgi:tRNA 2-thiocytidine biosynthesis protein TtcA
MKNPSKLHKLLRKQMEKAILEYRMIEKGDRVMVGVSGGVDSLVLIKLLAERKKYVELDFSLTAVHVDLGFEKVKGNQKRLGDFIKNLGIEYCIIPTQISKAALAPDASKNPCFICSHYRRKKIYEAAHQEQCNKIAYGHHKDDIIETLLMNILYSRKIEAMNPVQEVFKRKMYIIRPLTYVYEHSIKKFAQESNFPYLKSGCPVDGATRRDTVKAIIRNLEKKEKKANIKENIFKSLRHVNVSFAPWSLDSKKKDKR